MAYKYDYSDAEKNAKREERNLKAIKSRVDRIYSYITNIQANNLTAEQNFIIKYAGLTEEEVPNKDFYIEKSDEILGITSKLSRDELENQRYSVLLNLLFQFPNREIEMSNKTKDIFHREIKNFNAYTSTFASDPLLVKKMRNLQLLNRLAHKFESELFEITNRMLPEFLSFEKQDRRNIQMDIKALFSPIDEVVEDARQRLTGAFGQEVIDDIMYSRELVEYLNFSKWMYNQKSIYTFEILSDLEKTNGEYHYGKQMTENNGNKQIAYIFDVPGYGQFSVHRTMAEIEFKKLDKNINFWDKEDFLGMHNLLYKADKELIENVNLSELSDREKRIYEIVTQKVNNVSMEQYANARQSAFNIKFEVQKLNGIKEKISSLKEQKSELKRQIKENEEKMAKILSENDYPTEEIIRNIKELQVIIERQKRERAEIKKLKERCKEEKANAKKKVKEEKEELKNQVDDFFRD